MENVEVNSFGNRYYSTPLTPEQRAKRKDTEQKVAVGTGVTGAAAYQAKRTSVNRTLQDMFTKVTNVTKTTRQNAAEVTGLVGRFKVNLTKFSNDILSKAMKFKDIKYIGPIVKSPIMRGVAGIFGGAMAFFALVTGIDKAFRNGKLAIVDIKDRIGLNA